MRRLTKNLILAATVSAIFLVDLSPAGAATLPEPTCLLNTDRALNHIDFWAKFRDTVMPDKPQNNNPPKEMKKPPPPSKSRGGEQKPKR